LKNRIGFWLVSTPRKDLVGRVWTMDAPLAGSGDSEKLTAWLRLAPSIPIVANAAYRTQDDEYRDALAIQSLPIR
jgi:hypothetical protein